MLHYFIYLILVLIALYLYFYTTLEVKMGSPPINCMLIAYKYSYKDRKPASLLNELRAKFPSFNLIKFCYCGIKPNHVEYANGVILREDVNNLDPKLLEEAIRNGFSLFVTPIISHSVFIEVPATSFLTLSYMIGIAICYPRLFNYIEKNRLCGYPVIEVYRSTSLQIVVPLIQQDDFVVSEALRVVNSQKLSAMLRPLAPFVFTKPVKPLSKRLVQKQKG